MLCRPATCVHSPRGTTPRHHNQDGGSIGLEHHRGSLLPRKVCLRYIAEVRNDAPWAMKTPPRLIIQASRQVVTRGPTANSVDQRTLRCMLYIQFTSHHQLYPQIVVSIEFHRALFDYNNPEIILNTKLFDYNNVMTSLRFAASPQPTLWYQQL